MKQEIMDLCYLSLLFLGLFGVAELLYHQFKINVELTRKLVHVGTGVLTLLFPMMLDNLGSVLFLSGSFFVLLVLTLKYNLLQSVNAIQRKSVGSLVYPVAVTICFWVYLHFDKNYIYYYVPILILAFCDPVAALSGKNFPYGKYTIRTAQKTVLGSAMFFLSACLVYFCIIHFLHLNINKALIINVLIVSIFCTIAEAVTGNGYDNLTIPLAALCGLTLT
jgi:phytol kinase